MNTIIKCECGKTIEVTDDNIIGKKCIDCNEISTLDNFKGKRCIDCDKLKTKKWRDEHSSNWKSDGKYYKYVKKEKNNVN